MKKKTFLSFLWLPLFLLSCSSSDGMTLKSYSEEEPLNNYESYQVRIGIFNNLSRISLASSTQTFKEDPAFMYGSSDSSLASYSVVNMTEDISVGSDYSIVQAIKSETEEKSGMLITKKTKETRYTNKAMVNPKALSKDDPNYYSYYQKEETKDGGYDHYGTIYRLRVEDFSDSASVSENFNQMVQGLFNLDVYHMMTYFRTDKGYKGIYSTTSESVEDNPLYPEDATKKITFSSTYTMKVTISKDYEMTNYSIETSITPTLTYEGKANDKPATYGALSCDYEYGARSVLGDGFSASSYYERRDMTPLFVKYTRESLTADWVASDYNVLTDSSVNYQMANGGGYWYAGIITCEPDTGLVAYAFTTRGRYEAEEAPLYKNSDFSADDEFTSYAEGAYFNFADTESNSHNVSIIYGASGSLVSITIN